MIDKLLTSISSAFSRHFKLLYFIGLTGSLMLILALPFYEQLITFIISTNFVRFVLFWIFGASLLLIINTGRIKPWRATLYACCLCLLPTCIYCLVELNFTQNSIVDIFFNSICGACLGTLAGSWGSYVFEVYNTRLIDE